MSQIIQSDGLHVVVGMGLTGLSIARYLCGMKRRVAVMDTRDQPPHAQAFADLPLEALHVGGWSEVLLSQADHLYVSPGIPLATPEIQQATEQGARLSSDIELFFDGYKGKVVAITGSNGKSTVTTLVGEMAKAAGWSVGIGGNIGIPALELLEQQAVSALQLVVLELSSFQLELLQRVPASVVTLLNVTPDHMDRYDSFEAYHQAKHRIFRGCQAVVVNRDDPLTQPLIASSVLALGYSMQAPDLKDWGLEQRAGEYYLSKGQNALASTEIKLQGRHNWQNALAALALAEAVNIPCEAAFAALRTFPGLEHRCEWVRDWNGIRFINDSKATNPAAVEAALEGLGSLCSGRLLWIAGGQSKGADFSSMLPFVERYVSQAFYFGESRSRLSEAFAMVDHQVMDQMTAAVSAAAHIAEPGDCILLSPACASFDQFKNFEDRGRVFKESVHALI